MSSPWDNLVLNSRLSLKVLPSLLQSHTEAKELSLHCGPHLPVNHISPYLDLKLVRAVACPDGRAGWLFPLTPTARSCLAPAPSCILPGSLLAHFAVAACFSLGIFSAFLLLPFYVPERLLFLSVVQLLIVLPSSQECNLTRKSYLLFCYKY